MWNWCRKEINVMCTHPHLFLHCTIEELKVVGIVTKTRLKMAKWTRQWQSDTRWRQGDQKTNKSKEMGSRWSSKEEPYRQLLSLAVVSTCRESVWGLRPLFSQLGLKNTLRASLQRGKTAPQRVYWIWRTKLCTYAKMNCLEENCFDI